MKGFFGACLTAGLIFLATICGAATHTSGAKAPVGAYWSLRGHVVGYAVDDERLAKVIRGKNGKPQLKLLAPGTVTVTAKMADGNVWVLRLEITGSAVDERAVDQGAFAEEVLRFVNEERAKVHAAPLRLADDLMEGAAIRAREIVTKFSHTRPNGQGSETVFRNRGRGCGENIAAGATSPREVVRQWMDSPGHRRNILDKSYRELGVGHCYAGNSTYGHYWVQLFRI